MVELDFNTVHVNYILMEFVCLIVLIILWFQNKSRFKGVGFLVLSVFFQILCVLLIFLQGQIPDFLSIIVSYTFALYGVLLGLIGLEIFVDNKRNHTFNYLLLGVYFCLLNYFTFYSPNYDIRLLFTSFFYLILSFQCARLLLFQVSVTVRKTSFYVGLVFVGFCLLNIFRIFDFFVTNIARSSYVFSDSFDMIVAVSYQVLMLFLPFFIILMINKRLLNDIVMQETKFSITFHSVPYAIIISNYSNGRIIEVNEGFEQISGYCFSEVKDKLSVNLDLWYTPEDRDIFLSILNEGGRSEATEFLFRKKNGELITGEIQGEILMINNEKCLLVIINDISKRKEIENELKFSQNLLRKYTLNLQNQGEEDKLMLATKIDNELNQSLSALRMEIGIFKKQLLTKGDNSTVEELVKELDKTYKSVGETLGSSIKVMNILRHEILHLMGFIEAIKYYIDKFQIRTNILCKFNCEDSKLNMDQSTSTSLFRIFQSAMQNVEKHSQATVVEINFDILETKLLFEITDNGKGFVYKQLTAINNHGLLMMKERASLMDGTMDVISSPGNGTSIKIEIPYFDLVANKKS